MAHSDSSALVLSGFITVQTQDVASLHSLAFGVLMRYNGLVESQTVVVVRRWLRPLSLLPGRFPPQRKNDRRINMRGSAWWVVTPPACNSSFSRPFRVGCQTRRTRESSSQSFPDRPWSLCHGSASQDVLLRSKPPGFIPCGKMTEDTKSVKRS